MGSDPENPPGVQYYPPLWKGVDDQTAMDTGGKGIFLRVRRPPFYAHLVDTIGFGHQTDESVNKYEHKTI